MTIREIHPTRAITVRTYLVLSFLPFFVDAEWHFFKITFFRLKILLGIIMKNRIAHAKKVVCRILIHFGLLGGESFGLINKLR